MTRVTMYTTSWCPHCTRAKNILKAKGVEAIEEIDVEQLDGGRETMSKVAGGRMTVPQIFIAGRHVGGCDDLMALDAAGGLDPLLAG